MKVLTSFYTFMIFILSLIMTQLALAKSVNLYDQPKTDANVIGTIDLAAGVIPIFKSPDQQWVKVGDPHTGNVGWIKSIDIDNASAVTYTQKIINGKGQTEQTTQFGLSPTLTPKEKEELNRKLEMQQKNAIEQMNNAMQNMYKQMNIFLQNFPALLPGVKESPFNVKPPTPKPAKPDTTTTPTPTPTEPQATKPETHQP